MSKIKMLQLSKQYDKQKDNVIHDFNLEIKDKEFIVFVGPSGCGKSTTLRMIAGLESISGGELWMDGELVNDIPPKDRDMAMVFQNYALFPHLTVFDNIAFGLKIRKVKRDIIKEKVEKTAEILELTSYLKRKPKELSGGQRQRVALGRAIVRDANLFLMDEPLSNLDAKLRVQMREEIINLHKRLGTTTIYVTHDQTEAMTMASRIVVLKDGHVQQIGTPKEIYNHPENMFVASFIGAPAMNFFKGKITTDQLTFSNGDRLGALPAVIDKQGEAVIGIRPEDIVLSNKETGIPLQVDFIEMLGSDLYVYGKLHGDSLVVRLRPDYEIETGETIYIEFAQHKFHLFDPVTEQSLLHREELKK
ncbi:spermidine/putrescine ABC transporter ATP-binding protein [Oceanobacillus zhaokaii]|uniref:Spermidine/putrescine ABC transporter ATP-binding protein n=2 Tax=Oceanobacillus zhaokaii TaxID=2052660 RepID=A0A345PJW8_9BACI|nr:sn-glycerol-3-phosphate ABC transporter ATP-binding protein UgpC [Oceanobacillus zhaokaii]AXI10298.1 spermidine/putrescine ABC transporter ATP-binding protein [Oceanobacillus zhaokaii]